jgi:hypothetical protein
VVEVLAERNVFKGAVECVAGKLWVVRVDMVDWMQGVKVGRRRKEGRPANAEKDWS